LECVGQGAGGEGVWSGCGVLKIDRGEVNRPAWGEKKSQLPHVSQRKANMGHQRQNQDQQPHPINIDCGARGEGCWRK